MELKSSYIYIKGARFRACIGVSELERKVGNDYVADLRLCYHIGKAMLTDNVNDTISYADVYDIVKTVMQQPAKLLEHTAYRIAEAIIKIFPDIESIDLNLTKINPPMGADCSGAGIELHLINEKTKC